jgi:hypothetical protein
MFSARHSRAAVVVVMVLLPAVLAFGIQSALEVFHPLEERVSEPESHEHASVGDHPSLDDSSHGDLGQHEHQYCAHSNVFGSISSPRTRVQRVAVFVPDVFSLESVPLRNLLTVLDRGPPLL